MKKLVPIIVGALFVLSVGSASAADPPYVPYTSDYGSVLIANTWAGVVPLTVQAQLGPYPAIDVLDYLGRETVTIETDGQVHLWDNGTHTPRLVIQTDGYDGVDALAFYTAGSEVASVEANGEWEVWGQYVDSMSMRITTYSGYGHDTFSGGLDRDGRYVNRNGSAPDPDGMMNGESRTWFDPDPQTGGQKITMKFSDGTSQTYCDVGPCEAAAAQAPTDHHH